MPKTLRELELEDKLKGLVGLMSNVLWVISDIEQKILAEQRKVLLRNAFLGKFDRDDMRHVDTAIAHGMWLYLTASVALEHLSVAYHTTI